VWAARTRRRDPLIYFARGYRRLHAGAARDRAPGRLPGAETIENLNPGDADAAGSRRHLAP
jgi:hypothetical protein